MALLAWPSVQALSKALSQKPTALEKWQQWHAATIFHGDLDLRETHCSKEVRGNFRDTLSDQHCIRMQLMHRNRTERQEATWTYQWDNNSYRQKKMLCYKKMFPALWYRQKKMLCYMHKSQPAVKAESNGFKWFSDSAKTLQSSPVAFYKLVSG